MLIEQIRMHEKFGAAFLKQPRNVLVYLLPSYGANLQQRYPVFYMLDGQNLCFGK